MPIISILVSFLVIGAVTYYGSRLMLAIFAALSSVFSKKL